MTITAVCTSCGRRFEAPPQFAGKRVKCKACGTIFQVQASSAHDENAESDLDTLEQLEKTASGAEVDPSNSSSMKSRIGPRLEKKIESNPHADEIPINRPTQAYGRANIMPFRYPGAKQIDQWLPLGLLMFGLIGFASVVAGSRDTSDFTWIAMSRFAIAVLFYWAIIFPITAAMLAKAGREMGYRPPPNPKLRTFAVYMPAFALAACFWFAGNGSVMGLIVGAVFGLALSSGALWLLFRLREEELATSVSYGAGGFLLGAVISIAIILGLNLVAALVVTQAKAQAKIPASPFSPGLAWVAAPPPPAVVVHKPTPSITVSNAPISDSPVISELHADDTQFSAIIRSLSQSPIVGALSISDNYAVVEPRNSQSMKRETGSEFRVSIEAGKQPQAGDYAISTDGKRVARIAERPRLSVQVWSFESGRVEPFPLDHSLGVPSLLGFSSPTTLLVRWDSSDPKAAATPLKDYQIQILNTGTSSTQPAPARLEVKSLADSPASIAINTATARLVAVSVVDPVPTLFQFDLNSGKQVLADPVNEIDPSTANAPTGMAYSADGSQLAVLYEYPGGALLLCYDAKTGTKPDQNFVYTAWPPVGISPDSFKNHKENAIGWIDSSNLLLYGQGILNTKTGSVVANLSVPGVAGQRVLDDSHIELLTDDARRITLATLDRGKLAAILNPPATQP